MVCTSLGCIASITPTYYPIYPRLGIGFPLGSVATILSIGRAYGLFDNKWIYICSLVTFEAGSALCGGAPNMDAMIVGRVWAGVGGAGMYLG